MSVVADRLFKRLAEHGYTAIPESLCYATGGNRQHDQNIGKWGVDARSPDGALVTIYSFGSTMTQCARYGVTLSADRDGHAFEAFDKEYEQYR